MINISNSSHAVKLNKSRIRDVLMLSEPATSRRVVVKNYPDKSGAMREYKAMVACQHDPHFVQVLDFYEQDDRWHIVMDYVDGDTLAGVLKKLGPLEIEKTIDLGIDILTGLQILHESGYVHGDLHAKNILVTNLGRAQTKILDLQHAVKKLRSGKARAIRKIQKPHPMLAPESSTGIIDDRYDIYGVGYMCACMLTGIKLKKTLMKEDFHSNAHTLLNIIRKAMRKYPRKRYHSAQEMIIALQQARTK